MEDIILLTREQQQALEILKKGKNVFLTGKAGTGKSVLIREFCHWAVDEGKVIAICAPTGFAARNVDGVTLHRFAKLPVSPVGPSDYSAKALSKSKSPFMQAEIIVIDEISMCRADYFQFFVNTVRMADIEGRRAPKNGSPFSKQIVVVGDFFQLPPVITKTDRAALEELWDDLWVSEYPFDTPAWADCDFQVITLEKILRQRKSEESFVRQLNLIRTGDAKALNWMNTYAHHNCPDDTVQICPINQKVKEINEQKLAKLPSPPVLIKGTIEKDFKPSECPTEIDLVLKDGARVMAVNNDGMDRFANGDQGTCRIVYSPEAEGFSEISVDFDNGNNVVFYGKLADFESRTPEGEKRQWKTCTWENEKYVFVQEEVEETRNVPVEVDDEEAEPNEDGTRPKKTVYKEEKVKVLKKKLQKEVVGSFTQVPLKLAYAITVHKSQGQTFEKAVVHSGMFTAGQLYTALSRLSSADGLHLVGYLKTRDLITSIRVKEFEATLSPVDLATIALPDDKKAKILEASEIVYEEPDESDNATESEIRDTGSDLHERLHDFDRVLGLEKGSWEKTLLEVVAQTDPGQWSQMIDRNSLESEGSFKERLTSVLKKVLSVEASSGDESGRNGKIDNYEVLYILKDSKSWSELHKKLARLGLRYEKKRGGGVLRRYAEDGTFVEVPTSKLARWASPKHMIQRLGQFVAYA